MRWQNVAPGIRIGDWEKIGDTLTGLAGSVPRWERLKKFTETGCKAPPIEVRRVGDKVVFRLPIADGENLYGAGLHFQYLRLEHRVLHLRADHFGGRDNGRTHAPTPFHASNAGYGLLLDTPEPVSYYIGTTHRRDKLEKPVPRDRNTDLDWTPFCPPNFLEIAVTASGVRVVLFEGETLLETVQKFNLYCGGGALPPRWALGFWYRPPSLFSAADVMAIVERFQTHNFPLDVIGLEPGWQSSSYPCSYEWCKERFPNPEQFVAELLQRGIRVNLWENPYLAESAPLYKQLEPYCGSHFVWCGGVPDYTLPEVRNAIQGQHDQAHVALGVSGYKLDESDGYDCWLWPDHAEFPSGRNAVAIRNVYGLLFQRLTHDIFRKQNLRTCGLTRSTNAGGVRFPYVLYNDCYDFDEYATALCSCGFIGALWCPEVRSAKTATEWLRRFQLVALSPLAMLNAWADASEPWLFPEVETEVRAAIQLRQSLLPYLYSAFAHYHFDGIPPFRALVMDFGNFMNDTAVRAKLDGTANPYPTARRLEITDQYMMGDSIMVVIIKPGQTEREIVLPPGKWYDFYTGNLIGSSGVIRLAIGEKDPLPLLVRDGAVIPLQGTTRKYGGVEGSFSLYEDDGETFAYERGEYRFSTLK